LCAFRPAHQGVKKTELIIEPLVRGGSQAPLLHHTILLKSRRLRMVSRDRERTYDDKNPNQVKKPFVHPSIPNFNILQRDY